MKNRTCGIDNDIVEYLRAKLKRIFIMKQAILIA